MNVSIDYSVIAQSYDNAEFRSVSEVDGTLFEIAEQNQHTKVLDLACGTGNYLEKQRLLVRNATFFGMDKFHEMISQAKRKGIDNLLIANVDHGIPLISNSLDYIKCRYAFHHFKEKELVLSEVSRCLRSNGALSILDVEPYTNKRWWVYDLFPEVAETDRLRFWRPEALVAYLDAIGFNVVSTIKVGPEIMNKSKLLERLQLRDTSQLHMIDAQSYKRKVFEVEHWPEDRCIVGDFAFLFVNATKKLDK